MSASSAARSAAAMPALLERRLLVVSVAGIVAILALGGEQGALSVLDRPTALATSWLVNALGLPGTLDGTVLSHPSGFAIRIGYRCTVLLPALVVLGFLAALPVPAGRVSVGVALATLLLAILNSLRLAGLYFLGVHSPQQFHLAHDWVGQAAMGLAIIVFLVYWTRPGSRPYRDA